jgi:hypothetical protein
MLWVQVLFPLARLAYINYNNNSLVLAILILEAYQPRQIHPSKMNSKGPRRVTCNHADNCWEKSAETMDTVSLSAPFILNLKTRLK